MTIAWAICRYGTLIVLPVVILLNFYGLYTDRFYFFKADNYILPLVSILHLVYLYALRFKIKEGDYPDPQLRNVEFGMYAVLTIYIFKCAESLWILWGSEKYSPELIPDSFMPVGISMVILQILLVLLTLLAFYHRKRLVGRYDIEYLNEHVDSF